MTTAKEKIRIGHLDTIGGVLKELARVYREARRGQLATDEAGRLVTVLREMRCCIEGSEMEMRVRALEARTK